jgi:hypothetical protein
LRGLLGVLPHFSFVLKEDGAIFYVMVSFTVMVLTIRRPECVWASTAMAASALHAPSLAVLIWFMIEGPLVSSLRGLPEILFPVLRGPTGIRVNDVYLLGVAALIIIVTSWP